jgi:hypothetical protein
MNFWFEFLDIHINEKKKLIAMILNKKINIYPILIVLLAVQCLF